jgi:hypothetical protein
VGPARLRRRGLTVSRRRLIVLNVLLVAGSLVLLGVAALAMTGTEDDAPPEPRAPREHREPGPVVEEVRTRSPVGRFEKASCGVRPHSVRDPTRWFHPTDNFYPPDGQAPARADLDHLVINDGAVAVTYRADVSPGARRALRRWAATGIGVVVAPSRSSHPPPLEAYTAERRLSCDGVDLDQLTTFTDRHFSEPIGVEPHGSSSEEKAASGSGSTPR